MVFLAYWKLKMFQEERTTPGWQSICFFVPTIQDQTKSGGTSNHRRRCAFTSIYLYSSFNSQPCDCSEEWWWNVNNKRYFFPFQTALVYSNSEGSNVPWSILADPVIFLTKYKRRVVLFLGNVLSFLWNANVILRFLLALLQTSGQIQQGKRQGCSFHF